MKTNRYPTVELLLRRNVSLPQIAGYAVACFTGLTIILVAIQFYIDLSCSRDDGDTFFSRDYLIMSKPVGSLGLLGVGNGFSDAEVSQLQAQPWVDTVGFFTPSRFDVSASVDINGHEMSTALFFEAVPDEFFDTRPQGWTFDSINPVIPIILSRDYLALYNFGFAAARSLPRISEDMVSRVPLRISVSGNGRQQFFPARIVGFSSRLNTIAVPLGFMDWANARFGNTRPQSPSRLIVDVNSPGNPAIAQYLDDNGIELSGDRADSGKGVYMLSVTAAAVTCVGIVISLLSFFILSLSVHLMMQKNRLKINWLMQLGYSPRVIARGYCRGVAAVNAAVFLLSAVLTVVASSLWSAPMRQLGLSTVSPLPVIAGALTVMAVITAFSIGSIKRQVNAAFRI